LARRSNPEEILATFQVAEAKTARTS